MLTEHLLAFQSFDNVAEVPMSFWLDLLTGKHYYNFQDPVVVLVLILNHTHKI